MFNIGAFAGGLAQGIRSGENMGLRQKQAERTAQADEREAEMHQARMDRAAFNKEKHDRLRAANDEIVDGWQQANRQRSLPSSAFKPDHTDPNSGAEVETGRLFGHSAGSSSIGGLQSAKPATLPGNGSADHIADGGLMSQYKNQAAQKSTDIAPATATADKIIGTRMLIGDLLENPDELTRMAGIYKKHGLQREMTPWMNRAFESKKKRIPDALPYLLTGDAKGAREILKKGGINLMDDPVPMTAEDRQGHGWRFRLEDGSEQEVNLKELAESFFPGNIWQLNKSE